MPRFLTASIISIFVSSALLDCLCQGFVPTNTKSVDGTANKVMVARMPPHRAQLSTKRLNVIPPEISAEVEDARNQFFLWFFGASGGAGIARSAFPRMYQQVRTIQSLKGSTPSLGGEKLGISPFCGYPEDLCVKDVEQIVNNPMTVEQMVRQFPVEGNFLTKKGYLAFYAFEQANEGSNPLAIRAVFDTFAQSVDLTDPIVAQEKLDSYKRDVNQVRGALLKSKVTGYVSIFSLLFLLGLADVIAFGHAREGFFYYWKLEDGILNIPKYWL
jgi:hypothetical protein